MNLFKRILFVALMALTVNSVALAGLIEDHAVVAVMDFGTHPGAATCDVALVNAEKMSSEYVITKLINDHKMEVMDKDMVQHKLDAAHIKTEGIIDPDSAKVIGETLKCKYLIYGNVNDVTVSNTGVNTIFNNVDVCTVKSHIIARIMDVSTGTIVMAAKGEGVSKSSLVDINTLNAGIKIGSVMVPQESVHNAIKKAAFNAVEILENRLYGKHKK